MSAAQFPPFELLTPAGAAGGVAVFVLRGPARHQLAAYALRGVDGAASVRVDEKPRLASLVRAGEVLDQVLVFDRPDVEQLEVHTHGSPALVATIDAGSRAPRTESEALLRRALGDEQLALALEQRAYADWAQCVEELAARPRSAERTAAIAAIRTRSRVAVALAQPTPLVLCGVQNAGKSTLLNRLLFRERVLTGETPGLTRDPVRESVVLAGYPYELIDTAGEGTVGGGVDDAALGLARAARAEAALRILVVDAARAADPAQREVVRALCRTEVPVLTLFNKIDLATGAAADLESGLFAQPVLRISCLDPTASPKIRVEVGEALRALRRLPVAGPVGGLAALTAEQLAEFEHAFAG